MDDLISRQAAIAYSISGMIREIDGKKWIRVSEVRESIKTMPSAQPERKRGKWVVTSEFEDCRYAKCNQCNVTQVFYYNKPLTNYCPNCGADMRERRTDAETKV